MPSGFPFGRRRRLSFVTGPITLSVVALATIWSASGCKAAVGELTARVSDQWTRTYPLSASGELEGGVEARTVNGQLVISLRTVGRDPIDLRTTNGPVRLTFPSTAKLNLSASTVNGPIDTSGLALDLMGEQSHRRVRGRLNGG